MVIIQLSAHQAKKESVKQMVGCLMLPGAGVGLSPGRDSWHDLLLLHIVLSPLLLGLDPSHSSGRHFRK